MTVTGYGQDFSLAKGDVSCFGQTNGSITVTVLTEVNCGPPPYTFVLTGPAPSLAQQTSGIVNSPSHVFNSLSTGSYKVYAYVGNVICDSGSISVGTPNQIVINPAITQPSCNQNNAVGNNYLGAAIITVNGGTTGGCLNGCRGYNIQWSGPTSGGSLNGCPKEIVTCSQSAGTNTFTMSNLPAGTYNITVEDNNNCPATSNFTIIQPSAINVTNTITNVPCNGGSGSILVSPTGGTPGYSVSWGEQVQETQTGALLKRYPTLFLR